MKRIVLLAHRVPYPPDKGERIRPYHIIRHLAPGWEIRLGCLAFSDDEAQHARGLRDLCAEIEVARVRRPTQLARTLAGFRPGRPLMPAFYTSPALRRWTARTLPGADALLVSTAAMAPHAEGLAAPRRVIDFIDADSEKWRDYAAASPFPKNLLWAREARTLLAYERRLARTYDHALFVSAPERARFAERAPESEVKTSAIENGVDLDFFRPDLDLPTPFEPGTQNLVFTGHMDYRPNIDAVTWFARAVVPRPAPAHEKLRFWIVGASPTPAVLALAADPAIRVTGRVPDTRPYLRHADAAVCPLAIARGIQNKVLEAAAMGRPVVASAQAALGIRMEPGRDLLVAEDDENFADAVAAVLAGKGGALGPAARAAMERHYAWTATLAPLDGILAPGV